MGSMEEPGNMVDAIQYKQGPPSKPVAEGYTQALIDNPLLHRTRRQVQEDAQTFHSEHNLDEVVDVDVFVRGALIAREQDDPDAYKNFEGLTRIEKKALENEQKPGVWQQIKQLPKEFRIILATCCLAACTQGWDQQSINGANLSWPEHWHLNVDLNLKNHHTTDVWIFGAVNAAPYLSGAFVGCWLSDPLNEYFYGRRGAIFVASIFSFATVIGAACASSWQTLLICRVLLGFGMGAKASVVPIFISETAPTPIRGTLVICWQIFVTFGIFLGSVACLVVSDNWRYQIASAFIPPLPLLILVLLCVESPRWLLKKGRYGDAYRAYLKLRDTPLQACRDLYYIHCQIQSETQYFSKKARQEDEMEMRERHGSLESRSAFFDGQDNFQTEVRLTGYWQRFLQLFVVPRIRRATVAAVVVMISQQLCGINILSFLSSTIFNDAFNSGSAGLTDDKNKKTALWISFGFGLTNHLFTWLAVNNIDKLGRRWLLNRSFPLMAVTLLATGFCFYIHHTSVRVGLVATFFILFTLAYSPGEGPVAFTLSAEVFPLVNREVGMSFAVFWNLLGAGILALVVPQLTYAIGHPGLLFLFAGLNVVAFTLAYLLVPETARIGLEELNDIFEVPTREHVAYQIAMARWTFNHYIRRLDVEEPAPLYVWAKDRQPKRPPLQRSSSSWTR